MAKLTFVYGVMGAGKTAQLLMFKYQLESGGQRVLLLKPSTDTRVSATIVRSRIPGLVSEAVLFNPEKSLLRLVRNEQPDVVLVDEAQFLSAENVEELREIASYHEVPVFCYGLRTDFQCKLFEGSKALIELADDLKEFEGVCACGGKAIVNARFVNGVLTTEGKAIAIDKGEVSYKAMCWHCWQDEIAKGGKEIAV